ncbi:related to M.pneumoniae uridine kinase udk [Rhynchosporium graminicola]|uniref:Related to M.pneumoniae uridine kinase udk n=1 Tax=Rhynchosporium graminicola TaxID=2792576 RepID=A0A1E1LRA9_9HELO|nr:related to M.pneumoniae uridine kinase udk [Rhynchosporium commune]
MSNPRKAVVVGISGCSSSGKTTLARLLRDIFPNSFILHEDDFYRPETELPIKHGLLDWDCVESLSIPDMVKSLEHIHSEGTFPPTLDSKEDQNSIGRCPVSDTTIADLKARVKTWTEIGNPGYGILTDAENAVRLCVFDGFLLYSKALAPIQPQMDIKLFLRVSYAKAKARREARSGYVTLEGFWEDPPGYVDKIVWPNYVEDHEWMFEDGNVEGKLKKEVMDEMGILSQEGEVDRDMETTLKWAVEILLKRLPIAIRST